MTTKRRRQFTANFKKRVALEALRGDRTVQAIAAKHEVHPNQVGAWEAPGGRRAGGCLRWRQSIARLRARGDDPELAREDRRVDGGAGFFSARLATLSRAARLELVERDGELSIRRQCALLCINRSSVYYTPREERAENLALMRRMDELSLQYPFYGSRQMARHLGREGVSVGRRRVRRLRRLMGLEAVYRKPRTSAAQPGHRIYPYLLRELNDRAPGPGLVRRHHLHPGDGGFPVPGRGHGLGQPSRAGLAAVEHDGHRLLHRGAGSGASDGHARDLQHGSRGAVYEHDVH